MPPFYEEPLAPWERDLLGRAHNEGYGEVTFHRFDGRQVIIDNVRVDSIGPDTDTANRDGIVAEVESSDEMVHVPSVAYWTVRYRY